MDIKIVPQQTIPLSLLLEADPSKEKVLGYLADSVCFGIEIDQSLAAVAVIKEWQPGKFELMNIAVSPHHQQKGYGTSLLVHILEWVEKCGGSQIDVGTGSFGYQLAFYQKAGFRVSAIERDYFTRHYPSPLMENGLQHKDRILLTCHF